MVSRSKYCLANDLAAQLKTCLISHNQASADTSELAVQTMEVDGYLSKCVPSFRFVKRHFWHAALDLAVDRVVGVRMAVASLLPQLLQCCHLPTDQPMLERLEAVQVTHLPKAAVRIIPN